MNQVFSPDLLADPSRFCATYFSGEEEISQIRQCPVPKEPEPLFYGAWHPIIQMLVGLPLIYIIGSAVLYVIARATRLLGLYCLSTRCFILSVRLDMKACLFREYLDFGDRLLVPSYNNHNLWQADVYNRHSIDVEDIPNRNLKNLVKKHLSKVVFNNTREGGLCRGASHWFAYLFLKWSQETPSLPLWKRAYAVAKLFENGAPKQAALLQSYCGIEYAVLPLKRLKVPTNNGPVVAFANVPKHQMVYLCENDKRFIWDPNIGLLEIQTPKQLSNFLEDTYGVNQASLDHLLLRKENVDQSAS